MQISIIAEPIAKIGNVILTNSLVISWGVVITLAGLVAAMPRKLRAVPKGIQNIWEAFIENALAFMESVVGDEHTARKFFPVTMTIFLFVWFSNLVEVIPGLGTIGLFAEHEGKTVLIPFLRSASADLNFTLAIAIISVLYIQVSGIKSLGFLKHAKKFINFSSPMNFFVGLLELVSEVSRLISFTFRLFGNIFAGEVLLLVMTTLIPVIIPLPFLFLEVFVGLIQAFVFAMLTLVFLKLATAEAHH